MSNGWRFVVVAGISLVLLGGLQITGRTDDQPAKPRHLAAAGDSADASESPAPVKHTLVFKFHPDQILRYEVSNVTEITTHVKENTETVRNSSTTRRHYRVAKVDEKTGDANLELSIDWVRMVAVFENPDRKKTEPIEFQSDDPEKHPKQFQEVLDTVGKPRATIRFSPSGKPLEVVAGLPVKPPGAGNQPSPRPAAPPANDATPESYLLQLPEQPVTVGATWKDRYDVVVKDTENNRSRITIQRICTLAEVKDGRALIEFRTVILTPINNPAIAGQLIQREIAGKAVFDVARGLIVSQRRGRQRPSLARSGRRARCMPGASIAKNWSVKKSPPTAKATTERRRNNARQPL